MAIIYHFSCKLATQDHSRGNQEQPDLHLNRSESTTGLEGRSSGWILCCLRCRCYYWTGECNCCTGRWWCCVSDDWLTIHRAKGAPENCWLVKFEHGKWKFRKSSKATFHHSYGEQLPLKTAIRRQHCIWVQSSESTTRAKVRLKIKSRPLESLDEKRSDDFKKQNAKKSQQMEIPKCNNKLQNGWFWMKHKNRSKISRSALSVFSITF